MSTTQDNFLQSWSKHAKVYDPIKIGSIDGTDAEPHDRAVVRAVNSEYWPNRHVKGRPECTIFVARLSPKTTKDTIKEIFSKYGHLRRFRLVKDIVTGFPKGYAFIEYESERAAEEAYKRANKMVVDGQAIFVDFECERLLKGWKPRRLGGGFGGRKESGQLRFGGRDRPFRKPIQLEMQEREHNRKDYDHHKNERRRSHTDEDKPKYSHKSSYHRSSSRYKDNRRVYEENDGRGHRRHSSDFKNEEANEGTLEINCNNDEKIENQNSCHDTSDKSC